MIAVVVGLEDRASRNVRDRLLEEADWSEVEETPEFERAWTTEGFVMVEKEGLHLYFDGVDREIEDAGYDVELVVFVSRHSGDTGRLLSAHHTGNWSEAEHGGEPQSLAAPAPGAHRHLMQYFDEASPDGWNVSMEATHHGPSEVETPSVYAEVGSGEEEWRDEDAAQTVADAVLSLDDRGQPRWSFVGVGGGHYSPRFTRLVLETDAAFGHVVPDHELDDLDPTLLERATELSGADGVVLDGDGEEGDVDLGDMEVLSESYLRRRTGVEDNVADAVDRILGGGWTKTSRAEEVDDAGEVEEFGGVELGEEAYRTDAEATEAALGRHALAYSTDGEGIVDSVAVEAGEVEDLVGELADVLRDRFEVEVDIEDGVVRLRREEFDAERARELGVPEGPDFGRLSAGESVEADGRTVEPDDVTRSVEQEFELR